MKIGGASRRKMRKKIVRIFSSGASRRKCVKKLRKHFVTFLGLLTYNYIQELFTIKTQGEDR